MKLRTLIIGIGASLVFLPHSLQAGGNPEYVKFPAGYKDTYTHYSTANRVGKPLVAKMYANDTAVSSTKSNKSAAPGSVVIMEIYKTEQDKGGNPVIGQDGIYKTSKLAAVAVMERRDSWDAAYPEEERVGNWGFAIYKADGSPKENTLNCAECHTPLSSQDYLFSHDALLKHVGM